MANALMAMNPLKISVTANTPKLFTKSIQPLNHHRPSLVVRAQNKQSLNTVEQNTWNDRMKKIQQIALVGGMNALAVLPAMAFEKAALFDFNLTLPIIAAEFLLLMVALDKIWFTPLGKFMDERDEMIRKKLMSVRDNSEEIKKLQEEGEAMLQAARAEVAAALNKMKKETSEELEKKLMESREKVEKELAVALQKLEQQKQETLQSLDKQIEIVSAQIVKKVLPEAVKSKIKV